MYLYDYVLIFALDEEFTQFKRALSLFKSKIDPETNYHSHLQQYELQHEIDILLNVEDNKAFRIYATTQHIAGMVSADICTTKLIETYRPKNVVLLGIAANLDRDVVHGSVLIADFVTAYQQGKLVSCPLSLALHNGNGRCFRAMYNTYTFKRYK